MSPPPKNTCQAQTPPVHPSSQDAHQLEWGDTATGEGEGQSDTSDSLEWIPLSPSSVNRSDTEEENRQLGAQKPDQKAPLLPKDKKSRWEEMWVYLHTLPSKSDIESMINVKMEDHTARLEASLSAKVQEVRGDVASLIKKNGII